MVWIERAYFRSTHPIYIPSSELCTRLVRRGVCLEFGTNQRPTSANVTSSAVGQSYDCHSMDNMDERMPWILWESINKIQPNTAQRNGAYSIGYAIGPVYSIIESLIDRSGAWSIVQFLLFWWLMSCISWRHTKSCLIPRCLFAWTDHSYGTKQSN